MRIVVSAPPKSGNHWIGCLLSTIYGLQWPAPGGHAAARGPESLAAFVQNGGFPDGSMFHHHSRFSGRLCDVIDAIPAHHVTIVRDPYDVFVSMYYWEQERASRGLGQERPRPRNAMYGKPLDHEDVLAFLADGFGPHIARASGWLHSGRVISIRYEELHHDPVGALKRVTDQIEPIDVARIEGAINACRAERVRQQDEKMAWHVRAAKVGDSRDKLGPAHIDIFRERHGDLIRSLGYEVR
jgi:Sulfotransferase domain